jgi:hypothetical protein
MTKPKEGPSLRQVKITTCLADVENVRVENGKIRGRWVENTSYRFYGLPRANLLELYINNRGTDEAIAKFTRQYGPLEWEIEGWKAEWGPQPSLPQPDGSIKDWISSLDRWRSLQAYLQVGWRAIANMVSGQPGRCIEWQFRTIDGEEFALVNGHYEFLVFNLARWLKLQLSDIPANKLRICQKHQEDEKQRGEGMPVDDPCETPYFVAADLKQTYCSPKCAAWAQGRWKKLWWKKVGKPRRHQKRRQQATTRKKKRRR